MYNSLLPVLYPAMISEFNLSYTLVGMLVMGYNLSSGALQLVMGFLGAFVRKKILLGLGMIWQCIANSLMAFSYRFDAVFLNRTLAGIGASPQHPTASAYIAETFQKEQLGRALGLNIVGAQIGSFVAPIVGSLLLYSLGWRSTVLLLSIPGTLIGIAFLLIREPKRSQKWSGPSSISFFLKEVHKTLSERSVLGLMVLQMVMAFRTGAQDFLPSYFVQSLGMTTLHAGLIFTVFLGCGIPAPFLWGYLSDKLERKRIVIFVMGVAAVLWYLMPYAKGDLQLLLTLVSIGLVSQGVGGVVQAWVAESTGRENRDLVYGVFFTISFSLGSLSPAILGYITDTFGFQANFTWVAVVSLLAVVVAASLMK
jgi:FSR family fosmidomycin resistance protein-like MFS transporter